MRLFLFLFVTIILNAQDLNILLKKIPENSPNYSLAKILIYKTKNLKTTLPRINSTPLTKKQYINTLYKISEFISLQNSLNKQIKELENKISLLQKNQSPISKIQLAYYSKLLKIKQKEYVYLKKNLPLFENKLYKETDNILFNTAAAQKKISLLNKKISFIEKKLEELKIEKQKWSLLNNKTEVSFINRKIKFYKLKYKILEKDLLDNYLTIWLNYIKTKNKKAFETDNKIEKISKNISENTFKSLNQIIINFEKKKFGAKMFVYGAKKEIKLYSNKFLNIINYPLFKVGNRTITPLNFAIFIIVLIIGWFIGKYYKYFIYKLRHKKNISYSTATLLANMGYYSILTLSFLIALKVVGLDLSSLAIIAGALSVGIGFGLQNVVSNFVSGIILMFERSIKVGDYIQIDENTRGEVVDISMRSTIIRTNDNINLIIPNQSFIQNNVINWTLGDDFVRFRVPFGVAYGTDIEKVEKVILNAVTSAKLHYIKKHPTLDVTPTVIFMSMGESSLNFELFIWVKGEYARRPRRTRSDFLKVIYKALNDAGIEIPFPQQDLHIKDTVPFEIKIKK